MCSFHKNEWMKKKNNGKNRQDGKEAKDNDSIYN